MPSHKPSGGARSIQIACILLERSLARGEAFLESSGNNREQDELTALTRIAIKEATAVHMAMKRTTSSHKLDGLPSACNSMLVTSSSSSVHNMQVSSWPIAPFISAAASVKFLITSFGTVGVIFRLACHSSCVMGASVTPGARGCGHSFGKAWCNHCENNLPCKGTCPPFASAILSSLWRREIERFRGAATVSVGRAATSSAIKLGEATGCAMLRSKVSINTLHWSTQQKDWKPFSVPTQKLRP
mmetsp:Transcript_83989/g.211782  ORF Transcript_83989/g.211782 Transcript_83989/m.211782 type:complete len:244 (+) Transcript_83989:131-862(+)